MAMTGEGGTRPPGRRTGLFTIDPARGNRAGETTMTHQADILLHVFSVAFFLSFFRRSVSF